MDQLESSQFITIYYNFDKDQDNDSNKEDVKLVTFETLTIENLN